MSTRIAIARVEKLIWVLMYGGLLSFVISLFLGPQDASLAAWMAGGGLLVAATGAALIYVRSKMKAPP